MGFDRFLIRLVTAILGAIILFALPIFFSILAGWGDRFNASVILPNGFVIKREFDFSRLGRDDLYASDGRTILARDIEFVCFDDRYVALGHRVFDGETNALVPVNKVGDRYTTGVMEGPHSCNGYYTGWTGARMLYDDMKKHLMPFCDWRNTDNPALRNQEWLQRPCSSIGSLP